MKKLILQLIFASFIFTIVSCNDPIFFFVSEEEPPIKPRIEGRSTNFVEKEYIFDNLEVIMDGVPTILPPTPVTVMFVAAGTTLHMYYNYEYIDTESNTIKRSVWGSEGLGSRVRFLAVTNKYLYACVEGSGSHGILKRKDYSAAEPQEWVDIIDVGNIQRIFGVGEHLYISTRSGSKSVINFQVHVLSDAVDAPVPVDTGGNNVAMLCGVAASGADIFLCSIYDNFDKDNVKSGIFRTTAGSTTATRITAASADFGTSVGREFAGIINLTPTKVVAIDRDGRLYEVSTSGLKSLASFGDSRRRTTGSLAVWEDMDTPDPNSRLLLVGRQDTATTTTTGHTHGYLELKLDSAGETDGGFTEPGKTTPYSSVDSYDRYVSSLGRRGVNYMFQAKDGILFASTNNGVWSYKYRSSTKHNSWNAE